MPELIQCPSCQRELQVPEDFIGKPVKCPACGLNFVTTKQIQSTPLPRVGDAGTPPYHVSEPSFVPSFAPPPTPGTPALVIVAGMLLLFVGILGLSTELMVGVFLLNPEMFAAQDLPPQFQELMQQIQRDARLLMAMTGLFVLMNTIVLIGAIQMMRMRTWGLAVAAAVLAILHIRLPCCLLGAPVGIFTLAVLFQSGVRSRFQ